MDLQAIAQQMMADQKAAAAVRISVRPGLIARFFRAVFF